MDLQESDRHNLYQVRFYAFALTEIILESFLGVLAIAGGNLIYGFVYLSFVYSDATLEEAARIWPFWPFTMSLLWGLLLGSIAIALVKIANRLSKYSPRVPWSILIGNVVVLAALASVLPVFTGGQLFPFLLSYLFGIKGFRPGWSVY